MTELIIGSANYKGKSYRLLFAGKTKYGQKAHLAFSDGSKDFWVDLSLVEITKRYEKPKSLASILKYAEQVKSGERIPGHQYWTCRRCGCHFDYDAEDFCPKCGNMC